MRRILLVLVLIWLSGCSEAQPTLAGGKWADALRSPDAKLRKQAAFTLGNIGPTDPAVLPALLGALKDADARVRSEAILAMLKLGPQSKEAIPALTELEERDRDSKVRIYAAMALKKLQKDE
jgi:HEAT repeat protein